MNTKRQEEARRGAEDARTERARAAAEAKQARAEEAAVESREGSLAAAKGRWSCTAATEALYSGCPAGVATD